MQELFEHLFGKTNLSQFKKELHESVLLRHLSAGELEKVMRHASLRSFKKGDHVFFEGDPGSAVYVVLKGTVEIVKHKQKRKLLLARLEKGTFFGELALAGQLTRSASAYVSSDTTLVCLFKHDFDRLAAHYPKLGNKLYSALNQILAHRLIVMNEKFSEA